MARSHRLCTACTSRQRCQKLGKGAFSAHEPSRGNRAGARARARRRRRRAVHEHVSDANWFFSSDVHHLGLDLAACG
eukprot:4449357-Prymnesium_polylepis.1